MLGLVSMFKVQYYTNVAKNDKLVYGKYIDLNKFVRANVNIKLKHINRAKVYRIFFLNHVRVRNNVWPFLK